MLDTNIYDNGHKDEFKVLELDEGTKLEIDKDEFLKNIPPCIANMLKEGELKYRQRFYVMSYLINKGMSKTEIVNILKTYLKPERFEHIMKDEKHITYLFKKDILFPSCRQIKGEGLCPVLDICKQIKRLYR